MATVDVELTCGDSLVFPEEDHLRHQPIEGDLFA